MILVYLLFGDIKLMNLLSGLVNLGCATYQVLIFRVWFMGRLLKMDTPIKLMGMCISVLTSSQIMDVYLGEN